MKISISLIEAREIRDLVKKQIKEEIKTIGSSSFVLHDILTELKSEFEYDDMIQDAKECEVK